MEVLSAQARFLAAAMTKSSGVTDGLVRYLCLKNAAPKIQVAWVAIDRNFQHRWCLVDVARKKRLFAVFCIGLMFVWFVVYKGLQPNWNKWMFVVVVMAIDVRIGG